MSAWANMVRRPANIGGNTSAANTSNSAASDTSLRQSTLPAAPARSGITPRSRSAQPARGIRKGASPTACASDASFDQLAIDGLARAVRVELRAHPFAAGAAHARSQLLVAEQPHQTIGQRAPVRRREQQARHPVLDQL